jgi:CubicO group peptidase (beta-lactamase class C family)
MLLARTLVACLLGCFSLALPAAAALDAERADALLHAHFDPLFSTDEPGCVAGIARDGVLLAHQAYGLANMEHGIPMSIGMVFDIGSASKQFTAMSAAKLSLEGRLDLDADIIEYLPELGAKQYPITVRHLVHHSSGLPDPYPAMEWLSGNPDTIGISSDLPLKMARGMHALNFKPGQRYEYSNIGYLLLGQIVERVSGQALRAYVDEHFFQPLGMHTTHIHDDIQQLVPLRASAYDRDVNTGAWRWRHSDFDVAGDGAVYSTLADMARWFEVFTDPSRLADGEALLELALTMGDYAEGNPSYRGDAMGYAFGLMISGEGAGRRIGHPGGWGGYASASFYFPASRAAVISLCNVRRVEVLDAVIAIGPQLHD